MVNVYYLVKKKKKNSKERMVGFANGHCPPGAEFFVLKCHLECYGTMGLTTLGSGPLLVPPVSTPCWKNGTAGVLLQQSGADTVSPQVRLIL